MNGDHRDLHVLTHSFPTRRASDLLHYGVAVSGGPDSMALLWLMATLLPGQVGAATVDHGLRKGSADEARMVAGFCAREHIPHSILHPAAPLSGSLQAAARAERYQTGRAHV